MAGLSPEKMMDQEIDSKVEKNVRDFINVASDTYGQLCANEFSQEMWQNCAGDLGLDSPIEKLLWVSIHVVCKANYIELNADPVTIKGQEQPGYGMHIWPQFKLDKYRADFKAHLQGYKGAGQDWIIECDGHDFHERNKRERQYEKQRDRYFTVRGYKILRFTGSEIVKDPYAVAVEIVRAVTGDEDVLHPSDA